MWKRWASWGWRTRLQAEGTGEWGWLKESMLNATSLQGTAVPGFEGRG